MLKEISRNHRRYYVPKAHWELVRDPWEAPRKENAGIYTQDRFFNTEINPVDINAHQLELPEKEQEYWDKQAEIEEKCKELDEQFAEGDQYDEEKEQPQGDRPEVMAVAADDA